MKKADVFLSYSHDDAEVVAEIAEKMKGEGFDCWIDKDRLKAMDKYHVEINSAVNDCVVFVAFLSKSYVNKGYCNIEFNLSVDRAMKGECSLVVVCLDDVNVKTNRQSRAMLGFVVGDSLVGYGKGINTDEEVDAAVKMICESVPMTYLRKLNSGEADITMPELNTPAYLFSKLNFYYDHQKSQDGNYALSEIRKELFPAIKDPEIDIMFRDEEKQEVSLIKYISGNRQDGKNIILVGEGGMGKTVSLLKTTEYLLQNNVNAIYIPLNSLSKEKSLDDYLKRNVLGGVQKYWQTLTAIMSSQPTDGKASVVLLLDGINEMPVADDYAKSFINKLKRDYLDCYPNVQVIMTSRWFDAELMYQMSGDLVRLEMQPLSKMDISGYLGAMGIGSVQEELFSVLSTPLLLTLFADVEKHKEKYGHIEGIEIEENPNTAGKILKNFFQTQLYRSKEEEGEAFDWKEHLILLEYLLPEIAYDMISRESMSISRDGIWDIIDDAEDSERYEWYYRDRLRRIADVKGKMDFDALFSLAVESLHFLHETDDGYEFLHQNFRDYFAAYHVASEIKAFVKKPSRMEDVESVLAEKKYPKEILAYISDITKEEEAAPRMVETGYLFPGKKDSSKDGLANIVPSKNSPAECLLSSFRGEEGEKAQNAVYNLLKIMSIGRKKNLAWCDFSELDLRGCQMNGNAFVEWYEDSIYPSNFEGAWMDRSFLIHNGHDAEITAVTTDGEKYTFSGDKNGVVKIYDFTVHRWVKTLASGDSRVVDLRFDKKNGKLAVLYAKKLLIYSVKDWSLQEEYANPKRDKSYRYVRFMENGRPAVSYDIEPLFLFDMDGETASEDLGMDFDVPARCAVWHPEKKLFVRSYPLQMLSVDWWNEETGSWQQHKALIQKRDEENKRRKELKLRPISRMRMELRDYGAEGKDSVNGICFNPSGTGFLVAIDNILLEFDLDTLTLLRKKAFSQKLRSICYEGDTIVAGTTGYLYIMSDDFAVREVVEGAPVKSVRSVLRAPEGDGFYVMSGAGEFKKLDYQLRVQRIRRIRYSNKFVWVRDRLTNKIQAAFQPSKLYKYGARYEYDTNKMMHLGWRYEAANSFPGKETGKLYPLDTYIKYVGAENDYNEVLYTNYSGVIIFGCSFRDIKGEMAEEENIKLLVQNGGLDCE